MTMASRIVVMKLGRVQQIGTPKEIYNNPANLFVAGFIGSPSMNFFKVKYNDGVVTFATGETIKLPKEVIAGKTLPEDLVLGLRPEDIHGEGSDTAKAYPGAVFETEIKVAELLGSEYYLHSDFGGIDLVAKFNAEKEIKIGDKVKLAFNLSKVKFFDPKTEAAI